MIASKFDTAMRLAQEHHHRAMDHAERKEWPEALAEEVAAVGYYLPLDVEPLRSILCRSAASLALRMGDRVAAFALADIGLEGSPPECVAKELEDVWYEAEQSLYAAATRKATASSVLGRAAMRTIAAAAYEYDRKLRLAYADKPRFRDRLPAWLRRVIR